jgi:Zn ribbon nucleic-acid-binding protein
VQTTTEVGKGKVSMNINAILEMPEQDFADPNRNISLEVCRREPTWRGDNVDHKKCSRLTGWTTPRAFWFHAEAETQPLIDMWWKEMDQNMTECIDFAFREAKINREEYEIHSDWKVLHHSISRSRKVHFLVF